MSSYVVSARKYRPQSFSTVIGQENITSTLKNAIVNEKLAHAYLFCGPRGVGKTSCARLFAKTINCLSPVNKEACNKCESCLAFNENRSYNIHELDAASNNSVEDIRTINESVRIRPQIGNYSVYIIDEVHMLSTTAFNAFLKTLEEPPAHAIFILATTEKHKILPTILSRCQTYDFKRISVLNTIKQLQKIALNEGIKISEDSLNLVAQKADGAMRDALSIFDQVVSFCGNDIEYKQVVRQLNILDADYYFQLIEAFIIGDITKILLTVDEITDKGFNLQHFLMGMSSHFRNLLVAKDGKTVNLIEASQSIREKFLQQTSKCSNLHILKSLDIINKADINFKSSLNQRLHTELCLLNLLQVFNNQTETEKKTEKLDVINQTKDKRIAETKPSAKQEDNKTKPANKEVKTPENKEVKVEKKETKEAVTDNTSIPKTHKKTGIKQTVSIKDLMNSGISSKKTEPTKKNEEEVKTSTEKKYFEFTLENLKKSFKKLEQSPRLSDRYKTSIRLIHPEISDNQILIKVNNDIQLSDMKQMNGMLKTYFNRVFNKTDIEIILKMDETNSRKRNFTSADKFQYLAEKNPVLKLLKQKMSLDFE
ncbi:MAG: DNA polymerase III subunit gamma/tau [Marinifilaceae bacterium]|jgi:DNA polymerase-3 subunit gamma/tau|nr:DNA polymerase III subunit gamma/tau [Marinifilaceae bacterium]